MTCLEGEKAKKVMEEVHSGSCGNHSGGRSLAVKSDGGSTFWVLLANDDRRLREVRTKMRKMPKACSNHSTSSRSSLLHHIALSLYALGHGYRWIPSYSKQKHFLLVLTNFSSKWVEADSYASIKDVQVESFVWKNIICRHGVSYEIVTDNGSQFISTRSAKNGRYDSTSRRLGIRSVTDKLKRSIKPFSTD